MLPIDVLAAQEFKAHPGHRIADVSDISADEMILDAGPKSIEAVIARLQTMRTLVWNGPFGAFELEPFDTATVAVAKAAAALTRSGKLVSVAGGGDTVSALNHAGVGDDMTYISTAGGAFLEWMEGKPLPGVEALKR
jgi:phosphoglycerate kinase